MAQIHQNADGSYSKTYSDIEIAIIKELHTIKTSSHNQDLELWSAVGTLENRVQSLESAQIDLTDLQSTMNSQSLTLSDHEKRVEALENTSKIDVYSKEEVNRIVVPWKVEQIHRPFETPTNEMFDNANFHDIQVGYAHYPNADINDPHGFHFPPNTMRRYTIWAYCNDPRITQFRIRYADRCVVYQNGIEKASYTESGGNFNGTAKILTMQLENGWTKIQFLVSNQTQEGGLEVISDLAEQADILTSVDFVSGKFTGEQLEEGSLNESHFSPNMNMSVNTLNAGLTDKPAIKVGNPTKNGIMQIGDGLLSKTKDEPFILDGDVRIKGELLVEDLNIDASFIRFISISPELGITQEGNNFYVSIDLSDYVKVDDHQQLVESLDTLQTKHDNLKAAHDNLVLNYENLQDEYTNLKSDLDELKNRVAALESYHAGSGSSTP